MSLSESFVASTPIRTITTETVRKYCLTDARMTDEPYPLTVWYVATSKRYRIGLDVGGKLLVTSRTTLGNYRKSLLFKLVEDHSVLL